MPLPNYSIPMGLYAVPDAQLDLRSDKEIDHDISHPPPVSSEKNVWFFWHSGFHNMHSYAKRNIRAWQRRFSKQGWRIRVLDCADNSSSNVANFLDVKDPQTFPRAFIDGTLAGDHAAQHTSDLVRFPLLMKYGGVYADVGVLQIGDLDRLWNNTLGNPESSWEVLSYNVGHLGNLGLTNYFLCSTKNNAFITRCHRLFLALWAENGGRTTTEGMHASPLLEGVPNLPCQAFEADGISYNAEEASVLLTDYIAQGQAITKVMQSVDKADGWNGPKYVADHIYAMEFMVGAQLINELTQWDGPKQYRLLSLEMPKNGEKESEEQKQARDIVETCLQKSFGFKLATGLILKVMGDTLGSLWRKHDGSDDIPGTYAHWLRYAIANWNQVNLPPPQGFKLLDQGNGHLS